MARPRDPHAKRHIVTTRIDDPTKEWLCLWRPTGETSTQLADVLERAQKFWPHGPDKFGHGPDDQAPARPRTTPAVAREAAQRGISKAELINEMYQLYKERKEAGK